jgi:hypothetical protein
MHAKNVHYSILDPGGEGEPVVGQVRVQIRQG